MAKLNIVITETGEMRFSLNFLGHIYTEARTNKGECMGTPLNELMEQEIGEKLADMMDEFFAEDILGLTTAIDDNESVGMISDIVKMLTGYETQLKAEEVP